MARGRGLGRCRMYRRRPGHCATLEAVTLSRDSDPEAIKTLACAVLENAISCALSSSATWTPAEREDARRFLTDATDPRLERWVAALALDPDAVRDGIRRRLRGVLDDAA